MRKYMSVLLMCCLLCCVVSCGKQPAKIEEDSDVQQVFDPYPTPSLTIEPLKTNGTEVTFCASSNGYFYKNESLFYVKGINMGLTEPQTDLASPETSYETYYEWFSLIAQMNANTVRVFSVMNPNFYNALYDYNQANEPLYIVQGVWFSEDLMYTLSDAWDSEKTIINAFKRAARETIDIVHGNSSYTSYGSFSPAIYEKDVSKYVVGYILGLEYPASFVAKTNQHTEKSTFEGAFLSLKSGGSAFEAFLAEVGDYLILFETENYFAQSPVAFLSWQTLDTLTHSAEPFAEEEDGESINTENIVAKDNYYAGLFAALDVYPYYPEFMNYQPEYTSYSDSTGAANTFRAYISELKKQYTVPLMIAEYGLSSSRGVTHASVIGYNQGGLTEDEQGRYIAKMTEDIAKEGMCGSLLFCWQDEWFKRAWNAVMYYPDDPTKRTQNLSSSEQSFGVLQFDVSTVYPDGLFDEWKGAEKTVEDGKTKVYSAYDANYFHILIELPDGYDFENDTLYLPLSTTENGSSFAKEQNLSFSSPVDFLLVLNGKNRTRLLADGANDVFYQKYHVVKGIFGKENSEPYLNNSGSFNKINTLVANEMYLPLEEKTLPPQYYESGFLRYGNANPQSEIYDSLSDFYYADGKVEIRLAWYLLNVYNSRLKISVAPFENGDISFTTFDTVKIGIASAGKQTELVATGYNGIAKLTYTPRLKRSYYSMQEAFQSLFANN